MEMLTLVLALSAAPAPDADRIEQNAGAAAVIVRRSADALGGRDRLAGLAGIEFGYAGAARFPHQGKAPSMPGRFDYTDTTSVSFQENRMDVESGFTGGETAFTRITRFDASAAADLPSWSRQLRQSPHAVIREWLGSPQNLVLAAEMPGYWRIAGPLYGSTVHVSIDRETLLVDSVEVPFNDVRFGDSVARIEFRDYRKRDGWRVPAGLKVIEAGSTILDLPYSLYDLSATGPADEAEATAGTGEAPAAGAGETTLEPDRPSRETFLHRDLGDGVRALFNTGGPDYHSLAVTTDDGVLLIETPGSIRDGEAVATRASELGPVTFVAVTHHHGDHSGGLPGALAGAPAIVIAEPHRAFFRDMVTAQRRLLPRDFEPVAEARFVIVPLGGKRIVGDRVTVYDTGPTGHSDAQLVFYVRDSRALFQSDMAVFHWDGSVEPARTQTCRLREFIDETGLAVDSIVGGHGRPGTMADLETAISLRDEPCP